MSAYNSVKKQPSVVANTSQRGRAITAMQGLVAAVMVVLLILAVWYLTSRTSGPDVAEPAPPTSREAIPEIARETINEQQQEQAPDYAATLDEARSLRAEGKFADAQLLYFFAARGGHTPAAFELGELYDPLHFDASANLMEKPDAFQAFKWYREAAQAGHPEAPMRLEELQAWAEQAAAEGDVDADQLLLQWN